MTGRLRYFLVAIAIHCVTAHEVGAIHLRVSHGNHMKSTPEVHHVKSKQDMAELDTTGTDDVKEYDNGLVLIKDAEKDGGEKVAKEETTLTAQLDQEQAAAMSASGPILFICAIMGVLGLVIGVTVVAIIKANDNISKEEVGNTRSVLSDDIGENKSPQTEDDVAMVSPTMLEPARDEDAIEESNYLSDSESDNNASDDDDEGTFVNDLA